MLGRRRTDPAATATAFSPALGEVAVLHTLPTLRHLLTECERQRDTLRGWLHASVGDDLGWTTSSPGETW